MPQRLVGVCNESIGASDLTIDTVENVRKADDRVVCEADRRLHYDCPTGRRVGFLNRQCSTHQIAHRYAILKTNREPNLESLDLR